MKSKYRGMMEARRISRLNMNDAYDKLKQFKKDLKTSSGSRLYYLESLVSVLQDTLEQKEESIAMEEPGGEIGGGGGGMSGGSCAGSD